MKTVLEFNMPEDREELELAQNGYKYKLILEDFLNDLRQMYKHQNKTTVKIDYVREKIVQLCDEYEVKI